MKEQEYFGGATIVSSPSNCKLSYIENVGSLYASCTGTESEKVEKIKRFLSEAKIVVSFNIIHNTLVDFFKKNFELYSCVQIPVGYSGGYQYHIIIKNDNSAYGNKSYLRPVEKMAEKAPSLDRIEEVLTKTLKAKRRKIDIVKDVINSLSA